ncbi:GntR family transcriptional regulator [Microbacterium sp. NPDC028030]|uniref:GntR family transcriptional regulator n=1 Tax=Microbacterium sp. NPDC028030 TaxID=3155124 RepID=UPI0033D6B309
MTPDQIAASLSQSIREQEFPPGSALIQEDLAKRFKVSRNPVREALRILAANGLVTITPGNGATVRVLSLDELNELYDIRLALELQIAPFIIEGATKRAVAALHALVARMEAAETTADWMRLNFEYHQLVYSLANRRYTEDILHSVLSAVQPYSFQNAVQLDGRSRSDSAHREIIAAISEQDAANLARLFREHLQHTRERLSTLYEE